jgi:hypothetical protein
MVFVQNLGEGGDIGVIDDEDGGARTCEGDVRAYGTREDDDVERVFCFDL